MAKKTSTSALKVLVKQTRSGIGRDETFRRTLVALGLGKIGKSVELSVSPAVLGNLKKVSHVVQISIKE